ncbi:MAG: excinuclease ABC subunit UvrC [Myxococcota bacterium]|nr:excinuclease ABC subunit UvrC [Myxococcota bacterium]
MAKQPSLLEQAQRLPQSPGIYIFRNPKGKPLYVGKAKRLRSRVMQYINGHDGREMVSTLLRQSTQIDITLVSSDREALLVECGLIHKYRPWFNVRLVEGTQFLHIGIDLSHEWPRFFLVRKPKKRKHTRYFGPLPSAKSARETLTFLNRNFSYRTCSDRELKLAKRPCLEHQMHRCLAPCVDRCTPEEYADVIQNASTFLSGKKAPLLSQLETRMFHLAESERFEEAARMRDLLNHIRETISKQNVSIQDKSNIDAWGIHRAGVEGVVCILPMRNGLVQEAIQLPFKRLLDDEDADIVSSMISTWYGEDADIPAQILLGVLPTDQDALESVLTEWRGRRCKISNPKRGQKKQQLELAQANAESSYLRSTSDRQRRQGILLRLKEVCQLPKLPFRIECYDNSNIQGTDPVSSMVTFREGKPDKSPYRRFMIKTVEGSDDYASMREVLRRRLNRGLNQPTQGTGWDLPDLIVVDGGKGQLSAAIDVMMELDVTGVAVIGLAKPRTEHARGDLQASDKIILPGQSEPIRLPVHDPVLRMLQYIRDEAHDTAVGYHRKRRQKSRLRSQLDELPGIGPKRRKALIQHFGGVRAVLEADSAALSAVPGIGASMAHQIHSALHGDDNSSES